MLEVMYTVSVLDGTERGTPPALQGRIKGPVALGLRGTAYQIRIFEPELDSPASPASVIPRTIPQCEHGRNEDGKSAQTIKAKQQPSVRHPEMIKHLEEFSVNQL